jgi:uncharacterized protein (DUF362 family)
VVEAIKDYSNHVTIVESDGGSNSWTADEAFAGHQVDELCTRYGISAVNLSQQPAIEATINVEGRPETVRLPTCLLDESNFFVTMPVPKIHVMTGVSLGFKNQWGCLPDVKRLRNHYRFPRAVLAVNQLIRTRLAIFDGTWFMDRTGPMNGDPVRRDLLIAGEVGAASAACCEMMGIDPHKIPHLKLAMRCGLMPANRADYKCTADLDSLRQPFSLRRRPFDYLTLCVFHSSIATKLLYDSICAAPLHSLLYAVRGRPTDFKSAW